MGTHHIDSVLSIHGTSRRPAPRTREEQPDDTTSSADPVGATTSASARPHVLVIGVGGLGTELVHEALERDLPVSVLVRNPAKLDAALTADQRARLAAVNVGDGTDPAALDRAMVGIDVVLSGRGAAPEMAEAVAQAAARNGVAKLI